MIKIQEIWYFIFQDGKDAGAKLAGVVGVTKAAKNLNSKIGKVPKSCRANTMDLSKAQAIMGFSSTRWLDKSAGFNPKQELDKAHFEKMMEIMKKKKTWQPPKVKFIAFTGIILAQPRWAVGPLWI